MANTVKFTGKERDVETGFGAWQALDYFGARSFQSQTGRFTRPDDPGYGDPFNPQSMNLYAYALNSPLRFIDPTGHDPQCAHDACVTASPEPFDQGFWQFVANAFGSMLPEPISLRPDIAKALSESEVFGATPFGGSLRAAGTGAKLLWGFWKDYPKIQQAGRAYAQIGTRLYTEHAIGRMLPRGMGGRSIAPSFVEHVIATGSKSTQVVDGVARTVFTSGNVKVVTEQGGKVVVSVVRIGAP